MQLNTVSNWHLETKMGTYTTNYNLFMPTVGETGWGDLVNGNFSTIDSTMKSLSNRITTVENEVNGNLSCTSVTTSGKVAANGGLSSTTGTFSGAVTAASFNGIRLGNNLTYTVTPTSTYFRNNTTSYFDYISPMFGAKFSGEIGFRQYNPGMSNYSCYLAFPGISGVVQVSVPKTGDIVYASFSNVLGVTVRNEYVDRIEVSEYTIS